MANSCWVEHDDIDFTRQVFESDHPGVGNAGDPNPVWPLILTCLTWGLSVDRRPGGGVTLGGITDLELFAPDQVTALASLGFETHNYPAFIKMPEANLSDDVPAYLTSPDKLDPVTGEPAGRKTWAEWANSPRLAGGFAYVELHGGGIREKGSVIAQLVSAGKTIMSTDAVLLDLAQYEQPEPE